MSLYDWPKLELLGSPTPLEFLPRLSEALGREIFIKRDDVTPIAMGGNKLRKLEFIAADALREGADVLLTAGAIQSNHVRQTAAVAAKLGLKCMALLENPLGTNAENYLHNGNRLLLDLFNVEVVMTDGLTNPEQQLLVQSERLQAQGFRPYIVPVGGSSALGALGYIECAQEIAHQSEEIIDFAAVVVASGSGGTHAGLAVGLEQYLPQTELVGVTVSRKAADQQVVVENIRQSLAGLVKQPSSAPITLWDDFFAPAYAVPNAAGNEAVSLLAQLEGILLDPVYTGKAMAGLIAGISEQRFEREGPILFVHTGGAPALFAYHSGVPVSA